MLPIQSKAILLRKIYNKDDFSGWYDHNILGVEDELRLLYRNNVYQFIYGMVNLFNQLYIKSGVLEIANSAGLESRLLVDRFLSSGVRLMDNAVAQDNDAFTFFVTFATPLLVTPANFRSFSTFMFVGREMFWNKFISIMLQVPVLIVYYLEKQENVVDKDVHYMSWTTLANVMYTCTVGERHHVTWDFIVPSLCKNNADYRSYGKGVPEFVANRVKTLCAPLLPRLIRRGLIEKCLKSWDKLFCDGFFCFKSFAALGDQDDAIEWVKCESSLLFDRVSFDQDLDPFKHTATLWKIIYRHLSKYPNFKKDNSEYATSDTKSTMDEARRVIPLNMVNPLAVFGSLSEDDFGVIALLIANFYPVLKDYGVNWSFLTCLINFVMSRETLPEYQIKRRDITTLYNECISRKLFKVDKITGRTYIRSMDDYAFLYIIPLKLGCYNVKWYLKRDFYQFFKFFDSVYFKPKYLRILTHEGLSVLRKLSRFDAKVIDSVITTNFVNQESDI